MNEYEKYKLVDPKLDDEIAICLNYKRIVASHDIPEHNVKKGDIGGIIKYNASLPHVNSCWIGKNAFVDETSSVSENALVTDEARLEFHSMAMYNAVVKGNARLCKCVVLDRAIVKDSATLFNCSIDGTAIIEGNSNLFNCRIHNNAVVSLDNGLSIYSAIFGKDAWIKSENDLYVVGPLGSRNDYTTFYRSKAGVIYVSCGCFNGTIDRFKAAVLIKHNSIKSKVYRLEYLAAIKSAKKILGIKNKYGNHYD